MTYIVVFGLCSYVVLCVRDNKAHKLPVLLISYREDGLYRTIRSYKLLIYTLTSLSNLSFLC
jgi:hypothetical protein